MTQYAEPGVIPTLNRRGHTSGALNEYSTRFVDHLRTHRGAPVVDIGCAFGVATLPALQTGATVIAVDTEAEHLRGLIEHCPTDDRPRLVAVKAEFPNEIDLADSSVGAVHASNLFNYLTGPELLEGLFRIQRWLTPGGLLFSVSGTPYAANLGTFPAEYERRQAAGAAWPGYVTDLREFSDHPTLRDLPPALHLLDVDVLGRACETAGLVVVHAELYERAALPAYLRLDGRENLGLIARKADA
jgi:SAM-dependent methyltransferase